MTPTGHPHPYAASSAIGCRAPTAVTYPNGSEPPLATHFGRSPSAEEEYEWRIVPIPARAGRYLPVA